MPGLSTFALVSLGILFGLLLAALIVAVAAITYTLILQRRDARAMNARVARALEVNTQAIQLLRTEVVTSLARMDADRLHDASIGIQRASKSLTQTVSMLWKLVYKTTANSADEDSEYEYGSPLPPGLDEEAMDDAGKVSRAQAQAQAQVQLEHEPNPLDLLPPEERASRIHDFFAARRMHTPTPTPVSAQEALMQQAAAIVQEHGTKPHQNLPDFSPDDDLIDSLDASDSA